MRDAKPMTPTRRTRRRFVVVALAGFVVLVGVVALVDTRGPPTELWSRVAGPVLSGDPRMAHPVSHTPGGRPTDYSFASPMQPERSGVRVLVVPESFIDRVRRLLGSPPRRSASLYLLTDEQVVVDGATWRKWVYTIEEGSRPADAGRNGYGRR